MSLLLLCIYVYNFIYLLIYGCAGSSLLHGLFPSCEEQGLPSSCGARAFHCSGFSLCGDRLSDRMTSVVAACELSSCGTWA